MKMVSSSIDQFNNGKISCKDHQSDRKPMESTIRSTKPEKQCTYQSIKAQPSYMLLHGYYVVTCVTIISVVSPISRMHQMISLSCRLPKGIQNQTDHLLLMNCCCCHSTAMHSLAHNYTDVGLIQSLLFGAAIHGS